MPSLPRALICLLAVTLTLSVMGCSTQDKHVFVSTVQRPTTIALLDVYQNQSAWEMDIPVNHKLVLDFENNVHGRTGDSGEAPSWVDWKLYRSDDQPTDAGRGRKGTLISSDRVDLTGVKVRMQVSYRPSPEMPGSMSAAPVPVTDTAESVAAEAVAEAKAQAGKAPMAEPVEAQPAVEASQPEAVVEQAEQVVEEAAEQVEQAEQVVEEATEQVTEPEATK